MNRMKRAKRILLGILLLFTLITGLFVPPVSLSQAYAAEGTGGGGAASGLRQQVESTINSAASLAMNNHYSMDWVAVGLARAGKEVPADYLASVAGVTPAFTVKTRPTEYERMTLGILAAGGDPKNIGGCNMIKQIYNADLAAQGINAVIFGLIAVDAGNYDVPSDVRWTREKMIGYILSKECETGGWAMSPPTGDPDISGMAMTALAPYYNRRADVKAAVDRAVDYLSAIQKADTGGFASWGSINSESCAQVLMGLCTNGMDPAGEKFTKAGGNLVQALLSFKASDGGFKHTYSQSSSDGMATEQALYALDQYIYYLDGKGSIYQWGDKETAGTKTVTVRVEGKNGVILPDTQIQVAKESGDPTVKDAVLKALQDNNTAYAESGTGFTMIGTETADPSDNEKWLCSAEDGQPVGDMTARKIHNYESVVVYLGRDTTDYIYAWFGLQKTSPGFDISIYKPHEIQVYAGQETPLALNGYVFNSGESAYAMSPVSGAALYVDGEAYTKGGNAVFTDASGKAAIKIMTEGIHTVSAEKDGMRTARFTVTVLPDGIPPTVTFSSHLPEKIDPGKPDTIEYFWLYPFDNTAEGKDIAVSVTLNGNALEPTQTSSSSGARKYSSLVFDRYCSVLAVTLTDTSGNTQTITQLVINLNKPDDMAPAITAAGLTDGMTVSNAMLAFTVEVTDEQGAPVTPVVKLNGNALTAADDGISYTCTFTQGVNTITAEASDAVGNKAEQSYTVLYTTGGEPTAPDLTVTGLAVPSGLTAGSPATVTAEVYNNGAAGAGSFDVTLYAGSEPVGTQAVPGLAAGAGADVAFTWTPAGAGEITLRAVADSGGAVAESDETNNETDCSVTVEEDLPDGALVKVGSVSGEPGREVTVPVEIKNAAGLAGGQFTLTFDPAVAEATQVETGDFLTGFSFESNLSVAGEVYAAFAKDKGVDGSGELVRVTFLIQGAQGESTPVQISGLLLNDEEGQGISGEGKNGEITVTGSGILYGDVNGDGEVAAGDATLVLQDVVELITLTSEQITLGDVNGDGEVTAGDATLILRYVVELIDTFPAENR